MEEKIIKVFEKFESTILGQEAAFGWEVKSKKRIKNILWYKTNEFVLMRNIDEASKENNNVIEEKWNIIFKKYTEHMFKIFPIIWVATMLFNIAWFLMLIFRALDGAYFDSPIFIAFIVTLLCSFCILGFEIYNLRRSSHLEKISHEARQINIVKKAVKPNVPTLNDFTIEVTNQDISIEQLNLLKSKIINLFINQGPFIICDFEKRETSYKVYFNNHDFKLHFVFPLGKHFENFYLKVKDSVGDQFLIDDKEANVEFNGDDRFIQINEKSKILKIKWLITFSDDGILKKYNLIITLPICYEIK